MYYGYSVTRKQVDRESCRLLYSMYKVCIQHIFTIWCSDKRTDKYLYCSDTVEETILTRDPATCTLIQSTLQMGFYLSIYSVCYMPRLQSLMLSINFTPTADGIRLSTYKLSYDTVCTMYIKQCTVELSILD